MVAHERRLRSAALSDACDDECPTLKRECSGRKRSSRSAHARQELTFLRSRRGHEEDIVRDIRDRRYGVVIVSLRQALGGDTRRLHELLDELLDREDVVVLLFDGHRAVNYISGFGLSPCQHELMAFEMGPQWSEPLAQREWPWKEERGTNVKRAALVAVALAFVSMWVVMAAGLTAVWLTEAARVVGLVMLPTAIVAWLLVLSSWIGEEA